MVRPPETAPGNKQASPQATTPEQQAQIRLVFQSELGTAHAQLIKVESTVLYNALTTKRHPDLDAEDDGTLHSEVLKNAIDLLQRFHRCAPLYLKMGAAAGAGHRQRNNNFFAKDIFCRTFCSDIEGFDNRDNPRAWIDVFHFFQAVKKVWDGSLLGGLKVSARDMVAAGFDARDEVAKAGTRSRKGAVLWELMGLTSKAVDRYGNTEPETWCIEAAVRIGMWRKRLKEDGASLFRLPVVDDWGNHSDDVLPESNEDAMKLFRELEAKFRAFYLKCAEKMPEQATVLLEIYKLPRPATPEADQVNGTHDQKVPEEMIQRDGTSEEMTLDLNIQDTCRDVPPQRSIPKKFIQIKNKAPQTTTLQKRAHRQRALTLRANEQLIPRANIITQDPSKSTAPTRGAVRVTLEQAKELITGVLRANGREPDWEPELQRMVIGASLHLNGPL